MKFESSTFLVITAIIFLCPFSNIKSQNSQNFFLEKFSGTSWTNGSDTINFKKLSGAIEDWSDIVGPEMWYLYSVDGPFYVLPCEECYTANECHMCGYNAIEFNEDTLTLFWDYQNDYFAESEGVKFYSKQKNILSSFIFRSGYFEDYKSREIKWFPLNLDNAEKVEVFTENKKALDDFDEKKLIEREETEKDIFDY